jgi:Carbohydrate-selective porin, OprB family/S-layer homology domain
MRQRRFTPVVAMVAGIGMVPAAAPALAATPGYALDLESMGRYSEFAESTQGGLNQVTSIQQFADVQPSEWAYQALANLIERYGCIAGYPDGSFRGGRPITRYEAAALLNACLDRISEVTDELKRLMQEFERELALLRGRVDGLEAKVGELEATQFSTTTRLRGDTHWVLGGLSYSGNTVNNPVYTDPSARGYTPLREALTFNYDVRLIPASAVKTSCAPPCGPVTSPTLVSVRAPLRSPVWMPSSRKTAAPAVIAATW